MLLKPTQSLILYEDIKVFLFIKGKFVDVLSDNFNLESS